MSFKFGYMRQEAASLSSRADAKEAYGAKRGRNCQGCAAHSHFIKNFGQIAKRGVKMLDSPASCDQVDNSNNQSDHKQKMDQTASHMESPAQKPKNDEDCENRPKHRYPFK